MMLPTAPRLTALAALALTVGGCVFADGVRFKDTMGVCQARVLHVPPPPGQYEEVGFVTVTGGALASVETTRAALQQKACELGADAVYVADPGYGTCNAWELAYVDIDGVLLKSVATSPPTTTSAEPPAPIGG